MVSRKKRIFLSIVLMVELIFLATHWNDYIFTPVKINDVAEIQLYVGWRVFGVDSLTVDIENRDSIKTVIEYEEYFRKIDGITFLSKSMGYRIIITYRLKNNNIMIHTYELEEYPRYMQRLLFDIEEVRLLLQERGLM